MSSPLHAVCISGLPTGGDKNSSEIDKIKKVFENKKTQSRVFGEENMPVKFHLSTKEWYDGSIECEGHGVFIFEEGTPLDELVSKLDLKKVKIYDERYTMTSYFSQVCFECYCPLDTGVWVPGCKKPSVVDGNKCMSCEPDLSCCCCKKKFLEKKDLDKYEIDKKYRVCRDCMCDRVKQEEWRETEGKDVTETSTSYEEELHLSDEAIEKEKERMGGVPQPPQPEETPFQYPWRMEDLLIPTSRDYWPHGMTALQYLEHRKLMEFNNPLMETSYDDEWQGIEVTDEVVKEYFNSLGEALEKCKVTGFEEMEHIPKKITYQKDDFTLIEGFHGFSCDSLICQAVFQDLKFRDDDQSFNFTQFGLGNLPMFTTRKGDLNGNGREMGYGTERCIGCVMGFMDKLQSGCMRHLGDEID
jgi:hypothetical protein